ncbi:MAG: hypothetical protein JNG88_15035 [Phycisphaerales bacterium]|nr:hypothetical protein [Phycisphaerales bacterium]
MSKNKLAAFAVLASGFTMALGLNCLPNIGAVTSLSGILNALTGGLFGTN